MGENKPIEDIESCRVQADQSKSIHRARYDGHATIESRNGCEYVGLPKAHEERQQRSQPNRKADQAYSDQARCGGLDLHGNFVGKGDIDRSAGLGGLNRFARMG